jgi:Rps23 Pro-64 3,4-dihydroxylase Tpa1-like proline 4-hydroxylase
MINDLTLPEKVTANYKNAFPFPYIMIDNFLDETIMKKVVSEFKNYTNWTKDPTFEKEHEINKYYSPADYEDSMVLNQQAPFTKFILEYMYSPEVLDYMERLTGIPDLMPDTQFLGSGMHKIERGGKLSVHVDFNIQRSTGLHRRLNVLVYLNENWQDEWGGHLELWDKDLTKPYVKIAPLFNRVAIFNTSEHSYHGHPDPLNTPVGVSRNSMALYYYTKDRPENEKAPWHSVIWKTPIRS